MYRHSDFISSSILEILENGIVACAGIGEGIETYPLCDYIMQSIFLKMTGFQEQKMKFICWELATNDYDYRRKFFKNSLGECSSYDDKQIIYKEVNKHINKFSSFNAASLDRTSLLATTKAEVKNLFLDTNLMFWAQKDFYEFEMIWGEILNSDFANDNNTLFAETNGRMSLKQIYTGHLYQHRNRIAHNTQSYQKNLPRLETMMSEKFRYENYFVWISILVLLDKIFVELYARYQLALENKLY